MDAGSVEWVKRGVRKKAPEFIFRGFCFVRSALLEVEQPLGLHPTGIAQACDVDPRR